MHSSTGGTIILTFPKLISVLLYNKTRFSLFSSKSRTSLPKSRKGFIISVSIIIKKTYFNLQLGQFLSFCFVYRFVFRDESIRFGRASLACFAHQKVWIMAYSFLVCFSADTTRTEHRSTIKTWQDAFPHDLSQRV